MLHPFIWLIFIHFIGVVGRSFWKLQTSRRKDFSQFEVDSLLQLKDDISSGRCTIAAEDMDEEKNEASKRLKNMSARNRSSNDKPFHNIDYRGKLPNANLAPSTPLVRSANVSGKSNPNTSCKKQGKNESRKGDGSASTSVRITVASSLLGPDSEQALLAQINDKQRTLGLVKKAPKAPKVEKAPTSTHILDHGRGLALPKNMASPEGTIGNEKEYDDKVKKLLIKDEPKGGLASLENILDLATGGRSRKTKNTEINEKCDTSQPSSKPFIPSFMFRENLKALVSSKENASNKSPLSTRGTQSSKHREKQSNRIIVTDSIQKHNVKFDIPEEKRIKNMNTEPQADNRI